jgi:hypothetical protein
MSQPGQQGDCMADNVTRVGSKGVPAPRWCRRGLSKTQ